MLAEIAGGRWQPGIGDPTPMGWLTVAAYLLAAACCARASRCERRGRGRRGWGDPFWATLAMALLILGVNKQLDLQTALTEVGRHLARAQGWYDRRGQVQAAFVAAVAAAGLAATALLALAARRDRRRVAALLGAGGLAVFVTVRAASFHHVDRFLGLPIAGLRWNVVLELGGILVIAAAAAAAGRRPRRHRR